jgi:hypothetical protein
MASVIFVLKKLVFKTLVIDDLTAARGVDCCFAPFVSGFQSRSFWAASASADMPSVRMAFEFHISIKVLLVFCRVL